MQLQAPVSESPALLKSSTEHYVWRREEIRDPLAEHGNLVRLCVKERDNPGMKDGFANHIYNNNNNQTFYLKVPFKSLQVMNTKHRTAKEKTIKQ